uniref:Uncharacterized protein n=1 Tax=Oryza meridionalis TaxID=40149 RepID=A0A0E0ECM0_9ORYZ
MPSRKKTAPTGVAIVVSTPRASGTNASTHSPYQLRHPRQPQRYQGKRERVIIAELVTYKQLRLSPTHLPEDKPGSQEHSHPNEATRKKEQGGYRCPACHTRPSSSDSFPNTIYKLRRRDFMHHLHQTNHLADAKEIKHRQC